MSNTEHQLNVVDITTFSAFAARADYSLIDALRSDPEATQDGNDHQPRQVRSGHYVPVRPTPIGSPNYVAHSSAFFNELGLSDALAHDEEFRRLFSGDISVAQTPIQPFGWVTGYALSIYGKEYTQQCPFGNGNGYGDGRAISVFEGCFRGQRWEMQLKGGGKTPYCRGADGRAVLRSSLREFLAQEYMHALGVPTSRSLTLYASGTEVVRRPWYSEKSKTLNPDVLVSNPVAITTRVAPSFIRVGQLELFARRVRSDAHPDALNELTMIVQHLIQRNYAQVIDPSLGFAEQVVELSKHFRGRLTRLVANWLRVGYCQGNFNSDNCAAGGFTLDYGPFGFCELFDPRFQPWTGGGNHFSFFNQPAAAQANFQSFTAALRPLLTENPNALAQLDNIRDGFAEAMETELECMWRHKLGLRTFESSLVRELLRLMMRTKVDYAIFFRELSSIPDALAPLKRSFYEPSSEQLDAEWTDWLKRWRIRVCATGDVEEISNSMKRVNPSVNWREWSVVRAYQEAETGNHSLVHELQDVFCQPYEELPPTLAAEYDRVRPREFFNAGGVSHYSCSS